MKFKDLKTKKDRVAFIKDKLNTDNRWLLRGLLRIYQNQTPIEKSSYSSTEDNNIGFNKIDSRFLTAMSKRVSDNLSLSNEQIKAVRKTMLKYASQLEAFSK